MQKKKKRKPYRVYDRKIDRNVARTALKKQGVHRPNKCLSENWRTFTRKEA